MLSKTIELHLTSDPAMLSVMRAAIAKVCEIAEFDQMQTSKIVLALDEACSNIIRHAYKGKSGEEITIICRIRSHRLEFTLLDVGEPTDISKIKSRPLDEVRPGGLGVFLMQTVMDEVKFYQGNEQGNRLFMYINRPKRNEK